MRQQKARVKNQYFKMLVRVISIFSGVLVLLAGACWSFEKLWQIITGG
jgi:hypothetical protein